MFCFVALTWLNRIFEIFSRETRIWCLAKNLGYSLLSWTKTAWSYLRHCPLTGEVSWTDTLQARSETKRTTRSKVPPARNEPTGKMWDLLIWLNAESTGSGRGNNVRPQTIRQANNSSPLTCKYDYVKIINTN